MPESVERDRVSAIAATRKRRSLPPSEGPPLKRALSTKLPCVEGRVSDYVTDFNEEVACSQACPKD